MIKKRIVENRIKINRSTLPEIVAERLSEMIIEGEIQAGSRLNERELCERLGVSRTPLREAFRLLASEGLIDIEPNKGAKIPILSETDIRENFAVLSALEALSGKLACLHATNAQISKIQALTDRMEECYQKNDLSRYYRLNRKIHEQLLAASQNSLLEQVYTRLNRRIQNLRFQSNLDRKKWQNAMEEHLAMMDALTQRNAEQLAKLMQTHMTRKCETVIKELGSK